MAELLRSPDLKGVFATEVDPNDVKGQFDGTVSLQLPLASSLSASQIAANIEGR